jgi:hypothetical protein
MVCPYLRGGEEICFWQVSVFIHFPPGEFISTHFLNRGTDTFRYYLPGCVCNLGHLPFYIFYTGVVKNVSVINNRINRKQMMRKQEL